MGPTVDDGRLVMANTGCGIGPVGDGLLVLSGDLVGFSIMEGRRVGSVVFGLGGLVGRRVKGCDGVGKLVGDSVGAEGILGLVIGCDKDGRFVNGCDGVGKLVGDSVSGDGRTGLITGAGSGNSVGDGILRAVGCPVMAGGRGEVVPGGMLAVGVLRVGGIVSLGTCVGGFDLQYGFFIALESEPEPISCPFPAGWDPFEALEDDFPSPLIVLEPLSREPFILDAPFLLANKPEKTSGDFFLSSLVLLPVVLRCPCLQAV